MTFVRRWQIYLAGRPDTAMRFPTFSEAKKALLLVADTGKDDAPPGSWRARVRRSRRQLA